MSEEPDSELAQEKAINAGLQRIISAQDAEIAQLRMLLECTSRSSCIEVMPGAKPVFKTREEYEHFRASFAAQVAPELKKHAIARAKSEIEAQSRYIL